MALRLIGQHSWRDRLPPSFKFSNWSRNSAFTRYWVAREKVLFGLLAFINVVYKLFEAPGLSNKYKKNGCTTKGNFTVTSMFAI